MISAARIHFSMYLSVTEVQYGPCPTCISFEGYLTIKKFTTRWRSYFFCLFGSNLIHINIQAIAAAQQTGLSAA